MKFKRHKYGAKKVHKYGKKFDSMLECFFFERLVSNGITFEFQRKEVLQGKFRHNDKAVREVAMYIDFVITHNWKIYFIDTKGFFTDIARLKYKRLTHKLFMQGKDFDVMFIKNKKEAENIALLMKSITQNLG